MIKSINIFLLMMIRNLMLNVLHNISISINVFVLKQVLVINNFIN